MTAEALLPYTVWQFAMIIILAAGAGLLIALSCLRFLNRGYAFAFERRRIESIIAFAVLGALALVLLILYVSALHGAGACAILVCAEWGGWD